MTEIFLSNAEAKVAELVVSGPSTKEMAQKLFVTPQTIKFHLTSIFRKAGVKSKPELMVKLISKEIEVRIAKRKARGKWATKST